MVDTSAFWQRYSRWFVSTAGADRFCGCCEQEFIFSSILIPHLMFGLTLAWVPFYPLFIPEAIARLPILWRAFEFASTIPWYIGIVPGLAVAAVGFRATSAYARHLEEHYAAIEEAVEQLAEEHDAEVVKI